MLGAPGTLAGGLHAALQGPGAGWAVRTPFLEALRLGPVGCVYGCMATSSPCLCHGRAPRAAAPFTPQCRPLLCIVRLSPTRWQACAHLQERTILGGGHSTAGAVAAKATAAAETLQRACVRCSRRGCARSSSGTWCGARCARCPCACSSACSPGGRCALPLCAACHAGMPVQHGHACCLSPGCSTGSDEELLQRTSVEGVGV